MPLYALLTFGLLAATGNILGGLLVTRIPSLKVRWLNSLMALGTGFVLATVMLELIPTTLRQVGASARSALGMMLIGYLTLFVLSRIFDGHAHGDAESSVRLLAAATARRIVGALAIHSFFDGVTIASGLLVSRELGVLLLLAAVLHKIPEGLTVASLLLGAGDEAGTVTRATLLVAAATMVGVLSVLVLHPSVLHVLPFAAGVTLYVVATDLIPEISRERRWLGTLELGLGIVLFHLTHIFLEAVGLT